MRIVCVFLTFLFVFSCSRNEVGNYPVIAVDTIENINVYEDHSEALIHWLKQGYRDLVLINIDEHDDLRFIPEHKIERLKRLVVNKKWKEIQKAHDVGVPSLFTLADFIYAAYRLGVVKKLYWISPSGFLKWPDIEKGAHELLRAFGYPEEIIKNFKADGRIAKGRIYGLEVMLTSVENLPMIKEPVLVTFDVDYFSNSLWKLKKGELYIFSEFFSKIKKKNIRVKDVSIAYSVNGGYTEAIYRYLGDEVAMLLKRPDLATSNDYPELWKIREEGFKYYRRQEYQKSLKIFEEGITKFPADASFLGGKAAVLTMFDRKKEALAIIKKAVEISPGYAYLYVFLARELGKKKDYKWARVYLDEYLQLYPDSYYGLITYGDVFYDNAQDEEAFKYYSRILEMYDDVNAYMYAGDALFHLRRFDEAKRYYQKGLLLLSEVGYRSLRNYPEAVRNMRYLGLL